ncbi:MAG: preprotein translocase subunit SecA [Planctomycetes bacterium]|nr:preprotein translocase subunit SecA [Planctomycetota bacterium]
MGVPVVGTVMRKVFGTRNERMVKRYLRVVDQVSAQEQDIRPLSDPELRGMVDTFRQRLDAGEKPNDILPEVFAIAREAMDRNVGIRNIFNPKHNFDAAQLPDHARKLYDEVKAQIEATEPAEPTGDFLGSSEPVPAWLFVDIPPELYQAIRELYPQSKPPYRARPFDVQIIGAMVLYEGRIAEMKTGEGKTIVAPLACYLAILEGKQVHVVTVNDYLVQRDRDWTFPFFRALGVTVGTIHPRHMQADEQKLTAYQCQVVYGTTSEFGFDYLRDNMKLSTREQVQKHRDFAVVDEVDSTLIDEARTPLIISGLAHDYAPRYDMADKLACDLLGKQKEWNAADQKVHSCLVERSGLEGDIRNARDKSKIASLKERLESANRRLPELEAARDEHTQFYELELDKKKATITHDGITEAQRVAGVGSFYVGENIDIPHLLEQAIRAHTVYQRDRDYVVAPDEKGELTIVIVDQNTGRKMIGRQWSDGLHQAIEAKESVPIKQETQTMATITIQNFFKLYDRLAGMTGTADTEATEFHEIYKLDVIVIPTNVPVIRVDYNDVVFLATKDKWEAIVDEIKTFHDVGRPILVGTTSVENSEMLSEMLTRKHNIKHEVLNAKQHEREAEIIAGAGELGAVMIATNMAGRGTDIVLGKFAPEQLIDHWKRRSICPKDVNADMPQDEIVAAVYRQLATKELGLTKIDVREMSDDEIRMALLRKWAVDLCWLSESKVASMTEAQLLARLDESGGSLLHRLRLFKDIENVGGLHVIATERHESRRIDNQLRGRCGRQGDKGSSRFFLSLEDDLMKMFAGKTTLTVLSKLGMKEGDAIEHPMLTKSVGRAQRKVEERNFLIRKNILEYDEPMDVQRGFFYGLRQDILEGRAVKDLIFQFIDDSVEDAVYTFLDRNYVPNCIAEWVHEKLNVAIDADRFRGKDREDLHLLIRRDATEEAGNIIRVTIGEYMSPDMDPEGWDLKGLADWGNANFDAELKPSQLREMSVDDVIKQLDEAAAKRIAEADLAPLDQYLVPNYAEKELAKWAANKFASEVKAEAFVGLEDPTDAVDKLMADARAAYERRELTYPIDFALEMTSVGMQHDPQHAIEQFCVWVRSKYELQWDPQSLPSTDPIQLRQLLIAEAEKWDESRIAERADRALVAGTNPEKLDEWFATNCNTHLTDEERKRAVDDPKTVAEEKITSVLRAELTQFERWVLLQIVDQAWKDHLYAMDQVKEAIGFRSFSQRDPRIEFKREAGQLFENMQKSIREKVTDLIFKAKLSPAPPPGAQGAPQGVGVRPGPGGPVRRPAQPAIAAAAAAATAAGTLAQRRDLETAGRAGMPGGAARKRQPVRRNPTVVGRNEPCPCGSGKKYKRCCGKRT